MSIILEPHLYRSAKRRNLSADEDDVGDGETRKHPNVSSEMVPAGCAKVTPVAKSSRRAGVQFRRDLSTESRMPTGQIQLGTAKLLAQRYRMVVRVGYLEVKKRDAPKDSPHQHTQNAKLYPTERRTRLAVMSPRGFLPVCQSVSRSMVKSFRTIPKIRVANWAAGGLADGGREPEFDDPRFLRSQSKVANLRREISLAQSYKWKSQPHRWSFSLSGQNQLHDQQMVFGTRNPPRPLRKRSGVITRPNPGAFGTIIAQMTGATYQIHT